MFEQYFVKPATIDRIRGSWIANEIETYLGWLVEEGYTRQVDLASRADRVRVRRVRS